MWQSSLGGSSLLTYLGRNHPLSQGEQGRGKGRLCRQCECVTCHPFLPYIHTTYPCSLLCCCSSKTCCFSGHCTLKQIAASLLFSLTCVTLHWFCLKPAPLILSLTIRNPFSLLLPSHILTHSFLWVMSLHACLGQ